MHKEIFIASCLKCYEDYNVWASTRLWEDGLGSTAYDYCSKKCYDNDYDNHEGY